MTIYLNYPYCSCICENCYPDFSVGLQHFRYKSALKNPSYLVAAITVRNYMYIKMRKMLRKDFSDMSAFYKQNI